VQVALEWRSKERIPNGKNSAVWYVRLRGETSDNDSASLLQVLFEELGLDLLVVLGGPTYHDLISKIPFTKSERETNQPRALGSQCGCGPPWEG